MVPEEGIEETVVDEARLEVLDVIDSPLVVEIIFEDKELVDLDVLETNEGSDFDISVCADEADELIAFEDARNFVDSADGTVSVKACVVVVPPDKVVEESGFEDNSDIFDNEDSPTTLECDAVDAVETLKGCVGLLSVFDVTKLNGSVDFGVVVLEAVAVFEGLSEASTEVFEDWSDKEAEWELVGLDLRSVLEVIVCTDSFNTDDSAEVLTVAFSEADSSTTALLVNGSDVDV